MNAEQDPSTRYQHGAVTWRLHTTAPPQRVFRALTEPAEQTRYWCERAVATSTGYAFEFIDGTVADVEVLERRAGELLKIRYFGSAVEIRLDAAAPGTDLTLTATEIPSAEWLDVYAGWLNVLLPLKAWVDYGIDIRSHDRSRTWQEGFVDQ